MSGPTFVGGVLCGGRSRRMGRPKESLTIDGRTFLDRAIERHRPDDVLLSGSLTADGTTTVNDERPDAGPLGGLQSLLNAADADWLLISPVDTPLLTAADVARLRAVAERGLDDVVAFRSDGRVHLTIAAYRVVVCRPVVSRMLDADVRRMDAVCDRLRCRFLDCDAAHLRNINTPEDFAAIGGP